MPGGMGGGGGGGGNIDVSDAVNQISEMVQVGLQFAEHQVQQGIRFGEQKLEQGIRFGEDQLDKGIGYNENQTKAAIGELKTNIETGKAELREGFNRYQALNAPYRQASYQALDGLMDSMGMARPNVSSADMAKSLDAKAVQRGAEDRLRASGIGLLNQLPANLDPNIKQQIQYAVMSGANPSTVAAQLQRIVDAQGLGFGTDRDRSATQFERFKFLNSGVQVPTVGGEGEGGEGGGSGAGGGMNSRGGLMGGLFPNANSPFNSPEYLSPTQRAMVGNPATSNRVFNPLDTYLANSLGAYQDLSRSRMSQPQSQMGLASAIQNGMYSQQPRVVDIF